MQDRKDVDECLGTASDIGLRTQQGADEPTSKTHNSTSPYCSFHPCMLCNSSSSGTWVLISGFELESIPNYCR